MHIISMTDLEERAWLCYCQETAGSMDVRDFWEELPEYVQEIYKNKILKLETADV